MSYRLFGWIYLVTESLRNLLHGPWHHPAWNTHFLIFITTYLVIFSEFPEESCQNYLNINCQNVVLLQKPQALWFSAHKLHIKHGLSKGHQKTSWITWGLFKHWAQKVEKNGKICVQTQLVVSGCIHSGLHISRFFHFFKDRMYTGSINFTMDSY
jgi:hypothetical protein